MCTIFPSIITHSGEIYGENISSSLLNTTKLAILFTAIDPTTSYISQILAAFLVIAQTALSFVKPCFMATAADSAIIH